MLLSDFEHARPLGGPMEWGAAFVIGACARVAKARRVTPDVYYQSLLAEAEALYGGAAVRMLTRVAPA